MDSEARERLILAIATLAGIFCIFQSHVGGWEFWMPGIIVLGAISLWWLHITQKLDSYPRITIYFVYAAFLVFYHGVHENSLFDITLAFALFMATITLSDRVSLLNICIAEYLVVIILQGYLYFRGSNAMPDGHTIVRAIFNTVTMFILYLLARISVAGRLSEKDRVNKFRESVNASDRDMEDFLSNVSHELRTPINVISGMTALLQKKYNNIELASIQDAGIRLAYQIEDIQDYTELKRGEIALEEENFMCVSLINDVVANYHSIYQNNNLELVIDLSPETPAIMYGDIKKLHKVFRHLLDNAFKFTFKGGVYIKVYTVPRDYGVNLIIEITDTGIGMTRGEIANASQGMYQANKKRTRSTGGIGIGLPIVYGFVHKMGGFVMINSEKGKGSTIRISVPQTVIDSTPCLSIKGEVKEGIIFYIKPDKYKVPEVREFLRSLAVNLATGLKTRLYSATEKEELERLIKDLDVSYIFTGEEEYVSDKGLLDELAQKGYKVIVSASSENLVTLGSGILVMPKPMYAFPVVRILNGEEGSEAFASEDEKKLRFRDVHALVVDDEPMNLMVATGLLREYKMHTDTAESGKEAIMKYENGDYDIIFMDHMMPGMDGVETMKRIRDSAAQSGKTPVVVALTANALSGSREMFMKEGFDGFIAKPIDLRTFERVMKQVLPGDKMYYEGRDES